LVAIKSKSPMIRKEWSYSKVQWTILVFLGLNAFWGLMMTIRLWNFTSEDKSQHIQNPKTGEVVDMKRVPPEVRSPAVVDKYLRQWIASTWTWDGPLMAKDCSSSDSSHGIPTPASFSVGMMGVQAPYRSNKIPEIAARYEKLGFPISKFVNGKLKATVENTVDVVNLSEVKPGFWRADVAYTQRISGVGSDQHVVYSGAFELKAIPPDSNVWARKGSCYEEGAKKMQSKGLIITQFD
jgi:hypothetical protein